MRLRDYVARPFDPRRVLATLTMHDVQFVVIGGLAAVLHGWDGMTSDTDAVVARHEENLDRLCRALNELNARILVEGHHRGGPGQVIDRALAPNDFTSMISTRLGSDAGIIDVALDTSGVGPHDEWERRAVALRIDDQIVRVATLSDVIRSKRAAGRAKDDRVLPALEALLRLTDDSDGSNTDHHPD